MIGALPDRPKIYHIVHVDRLPSIIADGFLWSDAEIIQRAPPGTTIGMSNIKTRRLTKPLQSYPNLSVGDCVPFYFCPRSVMLYVIRMANDPDLDYRGGQQPIVHLEADLNDVVAWAGRHNARWAFTLSNAGSFYFEDRCDLARLREINWQAVEARQWSGRGVPSNLRHDKQAEFLVEHSFPWDLVSRIGVFSQQYYDLARDALRVANHKPQAEILRDWYY